MATVTRQIEAGGVPESRWRESEWLASLPLQSPAALLAGVQRLVVLGPHSDDEILACGGLLASAQASDTPVLVISVAVGEGCCPGQLQWPPARPRVMRLTELEHGLQSLGLGRRAERMVWQIAEGAVVAAEEWMEAQLNTVLQAGDLLLVPWRFDGHADHEACGRAGLRAAQRQGVAVREYPVWGWHWLDPQAAPRAWPAAARYALTAEASECKRQALCQLTTPAGEAQGLQCEPILPPPIMARFARHFEVLIG